MNRTYRAGLIGCGRIGAGISDAGSSRIRPHAEAYRKSSRIRLVAACDTDPVRLRRAADQWRIPAAYTDFRAMLEREKLDLLSIASPTPTHAPMLAAAASQRGLLGILLEKPAAGSAEQARELVKRMADSSVVVSLHYGRRFCPVYRRWAQAGSGGALGEIRHARGIYTGGMKNNGTHLLDLLRWFLEKQQGARVSVEACASSAYNLFELDLVGTEGRLRFTDLGHRLEYFKIQPRRGLAFRQLEARPHALATGLADSVRFALKNLVDTLEGKGTVHCTLEDGLRALEWADRLESRVEEGDLRAIQNV